VHPVDVSVRAGLHPFHKILAPPYIPGPEAAGEVVEVGARRGGIPDRTARLRPRDGGRLRRTRAPRRPWTLNLPDTYGFAEGAGIAVQFMTAWNAVVINARAAAGETVLVQGGAGGVGLAAIQLAKAVGCRVFATVSSSEKADLSRSVGADETINYREEDFAARCEELTDGRGVDVVIEMVAEENLDKDIDAIRPMGRIVVVGTDKGLDPDASFGVQKALIKDAQIRCMSMANLPPLLPEVVRGLSPMLETGKLKMHVFCEMPLVEANAAHDLIWSGDVTGKLVLIPSGA